MAERASSLTDRWFDSLRASFDTAAARVPVAEVGLQIADRSLLLRFAGPALEPVILPALRHVTAPSPVEHPSGEILLWDSESTGAPAPVPPWGPTAIGPLGEVAYPGVQALHDLGAGRLTVRDPSGPVLWWAAARQRIPWYERGAPLRAPLHWLLARGGRHLLHAAAVGVDGSAVLIAGRAGIGKSTLALACLEAGLDCAGDDYVLVTVGHPPVVHSLYACAKVSPTTLTLLPRLRHACVFDGGEKVVVDLIRLAGPRLRTEMQVKAVVVPEITGTASPRIHDLSAGDALLALGPSSILQLPSRQAGALGVIAEVVRRVPAVRLEIGDDLAAAAAAVAEILERSR